MPWTVTCTGYYPHQVHMAWNNWLISVGLAPGPFSVESGPKFARIGGVSGL
jgi:hypothetical protein